MKFEKFFSLLIVILATGVIFGCSGSGAGTAHDGATKKQVNSTLGGVAGNEIPIDSSGLNADNQNQPAIAYDHIHTTYLSVWTDYRSGDGDIWGTLCDGSTAKAGLQATLPACGTPFPIASGTGNQWQPKVAFDDSFVSGGNAVGEYLVVYADTSAGYSQIYGRFVDYHGTPAGVPFVISEHRAVADTSQIEPDVTYNNFINKFTVGWLGTSSYDTVDYPAAAPVTYSTTPTWKTGYTKTISAANAIVSVTLPDGTPLTNYTVSPATPTAANTVSVLTINASSNVIGTQGNLTVTYADSSKTSAGMNNSATTFAANDSFPITPTVAQSSLALVYLYTESGRVIAATATQQVLNGDNVNVALLAGSNLIGMPTAYWTSFKKSTVTWDAPLWQAGSPVVISNV